MKYLHLAAFGLAASLAACGGGGSSGSSAPAAPAVANPVPATNPPAASSSQSVLNTATLNGSPGFVNGAGHAVYVFDADLGTSGSVCSAACATVWPPLPPPAGVAITAPWGTITRSDGTTQLTYATTQGVRPLYLYAGDTSAGTANGDGLNQFGGLWHVARPSQTSSGGAAAAPTPAPSAAATTAPMPGPYG